MAQDQLRDANPSTSRDRLGQRLGSHGAIIVRPRGFRIYGIAGKRVLQCVEHRREQQGFKIARRFLVFPDISIQKRFRRRSVTRRQTIRTGRERDIHWFTQHQITSRSASSAPAALIACKIEITSRALAPILCNPPTNSSTLAPSPISRRFAGLSLACTSVLPTTSVFPGDKGAGWETEYSVEICTENPPCRMDTAPRCTSLPITMVPVRSFTTTRARRCTVTVTFSIRARSAVMFATPLAPASTSTRPPSRAL